MAEPEQHKNTRRIVQGHLPRNCTIVRTDLWRLAQQRTDEAAADKFLDLVEEAAAVVVAVAVAEVATEWRPRDNVAVA